ncbi:MAG: hypothetical protein AB4426_21695 [Xenococcaceae cyanobacterium]
MSHLAAFIKKAFRTDAALSHRNCRDAIACLQTDSFEQFLITMPLSHRNCRDAIACFQTDSFSYLLPKERGKVENRQVAAVKGETGDLHSIL